MSTARHWIPVPPVRPMSLFIVHSDRLAALKKREGMCQESWQSISPSDVSEPHQQKNENENVNLSILFSKWSWKAYADSSMASIILMRLPKTHSSPVGL